jgi:hypothetical protein
MRMPWIGREAIRGGFAAVVIASCAACSGNATTSSPSAAPTPSASAAPIASASPSRPSTDPRPSATEGDCKLPQPPPGPGTLTTTNADLRADLPEGYRQINLAVYRRALAASISQMTPDARKGSEALLGLIDSGEIRAIAQGRSGVGCAVAAIFVQDREDTSLEKAFDAWRAERDAVSTRYEVLSTNSVRLPLGRATRLVARLLGRAPGAVPSRSVVYFVSIGHGRIVELNGTTPFADSGFDSLLDAIAESLRATP